MIALVAVWGGGALHAKEQNRAVTFYTDIAPIVYRQCAPCHRPGESDPFSLLTYADAKRHASQIADVTKRRYMPPWLPTQTHGEFVEQRWLSDEEIRLIQRWVEQGAVAGSPAEAPPEPKSAAAWKLGPPDMVLHVKRPFRLTADSAEVFWNFVVPVPLTRERWVRAVDIRPGNPRVIHHASLIVDRSGSARRREKSPGSGFPGMDLTAEETTFDPDGTFLAWKPGNVPAAEPEGMSWRATPGMDLIFNVHMKPTGKAEIVDPEIGLYFTDRPRTQFPMLVELERDGSIDIPANDKDYVVADDFRVPLDVKVLAVYPHAHYLGKLLEGYATLPDGTRKELIRIPDWDLNWQGVYHFKDPVSLPAGSVISMRFHYDNSAGNVRNPNSPPKRVKGGSAANDEMGNLWLQVLPAEPGDHRAELEEALMRQRLEHEPADFTAHFNLGDLLLSRGEASGAVPEFEAAAHAQPGNVLAAAELGIALASASRASEAAEQFRKALELDPSFTDARFDLASVEAQSSEWEHAASDFKRVIVERPDDKNARQHLGEVLFLWGDQLEASGNHADAAKRYTESLAYRPNDADLLMSLGVALARAGQTVQARAEFETVLRIKPDFQPARQALAAIGSR
jgi:Flp pilus assembly protein TadD